MGEASGTGPPEGRVSGDASGPPPPDAEEARRADQFEGVERDLDTVDAALSALDSDDLEGAEALAARLEDSAGRPAAGESGSSGSAGRPAAGDGRPGDSAGEGVL